MGTRGSKARRVTRPVSAASALRDALLFRRPARAGRLGLARALRSDEHSVKMPAWMRASWLRRTGTLAVAIADQLRAPARVPVAQLDLASAAASTPAGGCGGRAGPC